MYVLKPNNRIDIEADHYFDFQDVKYCLYCGNRTLIEVAPERPATEPYKPDLSSLSSKDRALEELKEQMNDIRSIQAYPASLEKDNKKIRQD